MFKILFITCVYIMAVSWAVYIPEHTKSSQNYAKTLVFKGNTPLKLDLQKLGVYNNVNNDDDDNNEGQQNLITAKYTKTIKERQQQTPLLLLNIRKPQKSYDIFNGDDDVVNAKNRTSKTEHKNLEAQPTSLAELMQRQQQQQRQQQHSHHKYNNDVAVEDTNNDSYLALTQHSRHKRQLSDFLIAPNTRWCGRGNTANGTYNHLGGASMADKCCRTHDHCKLYIPAMSNRFDLFNYRPYTLSHCNCDRRFRTCLKMANDEDANTIGKLFFNLVQTQCFVLAKEVVCQQRASDGTCLKKHVKQKAYLRNNKKY